MFVVDTIFFTRAEEPGVFGSLGAGVGGEKNKEPEPLKKKTGAGAAKNMPLLYRLLEEKKA